MTFKVFTVEYRVGVVCYDALPQVVCTSMDDLESFCSLLESDKDVIEYRITSCGVTFSKKTLDADVEQCASWPSVHRKVSLVAVLPYSVVQYEEVFPSLLFALGR
jgi:hypothetical protein